MNLKIILSILLAAAGGFVVRQFGSYIYGRQAESFPAEDLSPPPYVRDTLDHAGNIYSWGNIIRRFGADSVWVLRRSDNLVMEKHYLDSLSPIRNISFIEGKKCYVYYRWWLMSGRVQSESFDRESGAVIFRSFNQEGDGVTDASGEHSPIVFYNEEYYLGGRIKTTGYQGLVAAVNVSVGRTSHYGEDGRLRIGKWDFYDEQGRTVRTERYSRFNERTGENIAQR